MYNVVGYAPSNSESNWMDNQHRRIVSCYAPLEGIEIVLALLAVKNLVRKLKDDT